MNVRGLTFMGTSSETWEAMATFVRDVLGLAPAPVAGSEYAFFALPDGSGLAVGPGDRPDTAGSDGRTIGFLVDGIDEAVAELRAEGVATDERVSANERYRYIHFRAPDGHVYELVEHVQPSA